MKFYNHNNQSVLITNIQVAFKIIEKQIVIKTNHFKKN